MSAALAERYRSDDCSVSFIATSTALSALGSIPVRLDHERADSAFSTLSDVAATEMLSVYDAAYLEVALRRALPLGCMHGPLRSAAARKGVPLDPGN